MTVFPRTTCTLVTTQLTLEEVDVEEEEGGGCEDAPIQKTIRRGGVSAEAIQEEDLGDYEKKVCNDCT